MTNRKGIDLLRYSVHMLDSCNESFNQRFTGEQLLTIAEAVQKCGWDFYPDQWEEQQVQDCIQFGITPEWKEENGRYVPVYKQTGENVYKVACVHTVCTNVEITANTMAEAIAFAEGDSGVPKGGEYLDDSFEIDLDATAELNPTLCELMKAEDS